MTRPERIKNIHFSRRFLKPGNSPRQKSCTSKGNTFPEYIDFSTPAGVGRITEIMGHSSSLAHHLSVLWPGVPEYLLMRKMHMIIPDLWGLLWLLNWVQYAEEMLIKYLCSHPAPGVLLKKNCTYNYSAVTETSENARPLTSQMSMFSSFFLKHWNVKNLHTWVWSQIWPLYPNTKLILKGTVLGEVEKNSFIALQGQGGRGS